LNTTKQDLLNKIEALQERIHSVLEESAATASQNLPEARFHANWSPEVDVYETEKEFVLTAELPGVEQDKIDLQIVNQVLYLRGQRELSKEFPKQIYHRLERPSGRFERRFNLPEAINQDEIRAKMTEGVLSVFLPKKRGRSQTINIKVSHNGSGSK
jgi:HSP20 family protein